MVQRVNEESGKSFQRVFVHFKRWANTEEAQRARKRVSEGKEIKIVYDEPWFWKVSMNRSAPRSASAVSEGRGRGRGKGKRVPPRLVIEPQDESMVEQQDEMLLQRKALFEPSTPRSPPPNFESSSSSHSSVIAPPPLSRSLSNEFDTQHELESEGEEAGVMLDYGDAVMMKTPAKRVRVPRKAATTAVTPI